MLEGWISDSEKTIAALIPPSSSSSTNNSAGENLTFVKCFIRSNSYRISKVNRMKISNDHKDIIIIYKSNY